MRFGKNNSHVLDPTIPTGSENNLKQSRKLGRIFGRKNKRNVILSIDKSHSVKTQDDIEMTLTSPLSGMSDYSISNQRMMRDKVQPHHVEDYLHRVNNLDVDGFISQVEKLGAELQDGIATIEEDYDNSSFDFSRPVKVEEKLSSHRYSRVIGCPPTLTPNSSVISHHSGIAGEDTFPPSPVESQTFKDDLSRFLEENSGSVNLNELEYIHRMQETKEGQKTTTNDPNERFEKKNKEATPTSGNKDANSASDWIGMYTDTGLGSFLKNISDSIEGSTLSSLHLKSNLEKFSYGQSQITSMASYLGSPIAALNAKTSTRENEDTDTNQQKSDFFGCVGDSVGAQIISNENVLMRAKSLCSPRDYSGDQAKQDISLRNTNIVNRKEEKLQVETNAPNGHGGVLSFDNYIGSPIVKLMKILNSEGPKVNKSNGGTNKKYGPTLECNDFSRNKNNETYRRNLGYTEPQNDFNPGDNRRDTSTLREYPIEKQSSYNSSSQSNGSNDSKGSSLKSEAFKRKKNSFRHKKKEKLSPLITKFSDTSITIEVPNRWRSVQQHETRKDIPIFDMVSPLNGEFITSTTDELGSSEPKAFFSEREPSVSPKAIISDPRSSSFSSDADIVKPMKNDKGKASYSKELTGSFSKNSLENGSCAETNNNMVENCSTTKRSIECEVNALTRNTEFGYPCLEKKNLGAETLVEVNNSLGSVPSLTDVLSRVSHYTDKENIVSVSEDVILSESTESTMCHEFKSKKDMVASDESIRTTDMLGHVLDKLESEVRPVRENRRIPPKNDKRLRARRRHDVRPPKVQEKNLELETISLNPHERTRSARKPSDLKPTSAQRRTRSGAEVVRPKIVQTRTRSATQYQSSPSPISLRNGRATPESIAGSRGSHTMGSRSRSCGPRSTSNEFRHSRSYDPRKVVLRQRYSQADNKNPLFDYEEDSLEDMNNYGAKNLPTKLSKQQSVLDKALDKYLDFVEDVFGV